MPLQRNPLNWKRILKVYWQNNHKKRPEIFQDVFCGRDAACHVSTERFETIENRLFFFCCLFSVVSCLPANQNAYFE